MNPFEMVVLIVGIIAVVRIVQARHGIVRRGRGEAVVTASDDGETQRLRDDVRMLKERVAVLERLATDNHGALSLDREIERLR